MLDPTRSIIDEIREDLALDDYYRRFGQMPNLDDEYDGRQVVVEYEFDFAE